VSRVAKRVKGVTQWQPPDLVSPMTFLPQARSWALGWRALAGPGWRDGSGREEAKGGRGATGRERGWSSWDQCEASPQGQPPAAAIRLREERRKPPLPEPRARAPVLGASCGQRTKAKSHAQKNVSANRLNLGRAKRELNGVACHRQRVGWVECAIGACAGRRAAYQ
jgi:hypothetical protein